MVLNDTPKMVHRSTQLVQAGKTKYGAMLDIDDGVSPRKLPKPESINEIIQKANPLRGKPEGENNCVPSAVASFLRSICVDATAKGTGGEMKNLAGVVEECFKGATIKDGTATTFGKSRDDAARMLVKKFGDNAEGVCGVTWKDRTGHAFNWKIKNGVVSFFDGNTAYDDNIIGKYYFRNIDRNGALILARLDNAEPDYSAISKYVNLR